MHEGKSIVTTGVKRRQEVSSSIYYFALAIVKGCVGGAGERLMLKAVQRPGLLSTC